MTDPTDAIKEIEATSPEMRFELLDGQFVLGGRLAGSRWLLREILKGWGLESALAFAPLKLWYEALRIAFDAPSGSNFQSLAGKTAYQAPSIPPLGSQYVGEHWHVRTVLKQDLYSAVGIGSLGRCIGSDFVMRLGEDALTPDLMFMQVNRLEGYHNWFFEGPADLVIEVLLPEHAELDKKERFSRYEVGGINHYWTIDPVQQQTELFRLVSGRYQLQTLDPDGCYRGIEGLTFAPLHLWLPYDQKLPVFQAPYQKGNWVIREVEGEELVWGTQPFAPQVDLEPIPIQFEQFISWCPEGKLEGYGGRFPILGGEMGTRNALGMLLMSLGLVETVKLFPPQDWGTALVRVEQQYSASSEQRQKAWSLARKAARQLHHDYQIAGVGVIGDLVRPESPWNFWSKISLVVWDVPKQVNLWRLGGNWGREFKIDWVEPAWCTPAQWQQITTEMEVLVGDWVESRHAPVRKRYKLFRDPEKGN
jgi:hypothetical protein